MTAALKNVATVFRVIFSRRIRPPLLAVDPLSLVIEPAVDVSAVREADNRIRLRWILSADSVAIFASHHADTDGTLLHTASGVQDALLDGLDPNRRYYFTLVFQRGSVILRLRVAERSLPFTNQINVRDLGGYPTADGKRTRWGLVYRSGSVSHMTDSDQVYWQQLGLQWICDLRSEREVDRSPDVMPAPSTEYLRLPMFTEKESTAGVRKFLLNLNNLQVALMQSYIQMLEEKGHIFGTIFRRLLEPDGLPGLFHCTAGKDRTGVTAMLLLGALGVADDLIVADYTLTNRFHHNLRAQLSANSRGLRILRLSQDDLMPVLLAHPDTLRGTINHLRDRYGTYAHYLAAQAGISAADLARLRDRLLE